MRKTNTSNIVVIIGIISIVLPIIMLLEEISRRIGEYGHLLSLDTNWFIFYSFFVLIGISFLYSSYRISKGKSITILMYLGIFCGIFFSFILFFFWRRYTLFNEVMYPSLFVFYLVVLTWWVIYITREGTPMNTLKQRFAKGEITEEEYDKMKKKLED